MIRKPNFKLNWKYALGEVALIFVGISLAIAFQNWNDQRKKEILEKIYLEELLDDCRRDSTLLASYIKLSEGKYIDGLEVYKSLETRVIQWDSSYFISRLFFTGRYLEYRPYFPTYDELISTGNLNVIENRVLKDDIRKFIQRSRNDQTFWANEFRQRKQNYNEHIYQYFDAEIMSMLWELPTVERDDGSRDKVITRNDVMGAFRTDIKGFFNDPKSKIMVESCKGVDRDLVRTYGVDLNNLSEIMDQIRFELK